MSSLFGLNKPNTNLRKNVFDLSEKSLFSMSAGQLIPCMVKEANPGEKFQISVASLTRTMPLNTAGFIRCRQYYHFFFVPFRQLWSGWDNFINGVNYRTSALQKQPSTRVPALDLFSVLSRMYIGGALSPYDGDGRDPLLANDEMGIPYYLGMSRLLDMLGYGLHSSTRDNVSAYSSLSELVENLLWQPYEVEETRGSGSTATKVKVTKYRKGDSARIRSVEALLTNNRLLVNPFRLLAYQKIYSDFYKRDDYESTSPEHFNIDDFIGEENINGSVRVAGSEGLKRLVGMLRLRYRWQPKDYFTGVVPSELFNVGSLSSLTDGLIRTMNVDLTTEVDGDKVTVADTDHTISTKSIRAAFAIEKLLRLSRRAGGHDYISQTAAHYGFDVPKGRGDKVEFLGGFTNNIEINEVTATAGTAQAVVGQSFGKGIGVVNGGKDVEFTAKEHGIVMCITSVVPEVDYSAEGLDAFNAKFDRGDYFHPEFQDLGLQPVFGYELKNYWASQMPSISYGQDEVIARRIGGHGRHGDADEIYIRRSDKQSIVISDVEISGTKNAILGFNPRYAEYKTSYDKLHGEFRNGRSLSAWSGSNMLDYNKTGVLINTLKIDARCLNRVFSVAYDGREMNDQFMVGAQFVVKAIRPMSITGQSL